MFSTAAPYKNQQYRELKNDCIRDAKLFEDPEFPATSSSLYFRKPPPGFVEWKRPGVSSASIHPSKIQIFASLEEVSTIILNFNVHFLVSGDMPGALSVCGRHQLP